MSDKFKIIGLGDAGVNSISNINHPLTFQFRNQLQWDNRGRFPRTEYSIIICSPAGKFASKHLFSLIESLRMNQERIFLISIMPFLNESRDRIERAIRIFNEASRRVDRTFLIENENFAQRHLNETLEKFLESVNVTVSHTVDVLKSHMNDLGDIKKLGFAVSSGERINELETNLTFSNSRKDPEAIIGVIEAPTKYEAAYISQTFGIDMLEYLYSPYYGIYGFTVHEHDFDTQWYPSELYIHSR